MARPHLVTAVLAGFLIPACGGGGDSGDGFDAGTGGGGTAADMGGGELGSGTDGSGPGTEEGGGSSGGETTTRHHLSFKFDYRFDRAGFFDLEERRAALEAAGEAWSRRLFDDFPEIPAGVEVRVADPENRDAYQFVTLTEPVDDIIIFVGTSTNIPGLGRGGPSRVANGGTGLEARFNGADFQPWAGSITFNPSYDWYFDPTPDDPPSAPGNAFDFVSSATHEIGHVLGFGTSPAWATHVQGNTFAGPLAVAKFGGPVPIDGDHIAKDTSFQRTRPVMIPSLRPQIRDSPTGLDYAMLQDLGFEFGF